MIFWFEKFESKCFWHAKTVQETEGCHAKNKTKVCWEGMHKVNQIILDEKMTSSSSTVSGDDFSNTTMKLNTTILMHKELQQNLSSTSKHVYTDL